MPNRRKPSTIEARRYRAKMARLLTPEAMATWPKPSHLAALWKALRRAERRWPRPTRPLIVKGNTLSELSTVRWLDGWRVLMDVPLSAFPANVRPKLLDSLRSSLDAMCMHGRSTMGVCGQCMAGLDDEGLD